MHLVSSVPGYTLSLAQLKHATDVLAAHTFRPGTTSNHIHQANSFIEFCNDYHLHFICPSSSTLCCYITHLTCHVQSSKSVHNYISGVRFLHRQLGLTSTAIDSFPVISLPHVEDITMCTHHHPSTSPSSHTFFIISVSSSPAWGHPCGCV